jgi:hypothetical protein
MGNTRHWICLSALILTRARVVIGTLGSYQLGRIDVKTGIMGKTRSLWETHGQMMAIVNLTGAIPLKRLLNA